MLVKYLLISFFLILGFISCGHQKTYQIVFRPEAKDFKNVGIEIPKIPVYFGYRIREKKSGDIVSKGAGTIDGDPTSWTIETQNFIVKRGRDYQIEYNLMMVVLSSEISSDFPVYFQSTEVTNSNFHAKICAFKIEASDKEGQEYSCGITEPTTEVVKKVLALKVNGLNEVDNSNLTISQHFQVYLYDELQGGPVSIPGGAFYSDPIFVTGSDKSIRMAQLLPVFDFDPPLALELVSSANDNTSLLIPLHRTTNEGAPFCYPSSSSNYCFVNVDFATGASGDSLSDCSYSHAGGASQTKACKISPNDMTSTGVDKFLRAAECADCNSEIRLTSLSPPLKSPVFPDIVTADMPNPMIKYLDSSGGSVQYNLKMDSNFSTYSVGKLFYGMSFYGSPKIQFFCSCSGNSPSNLPCDISPSDGSDAVLSVACPSGDNLIIKAIDGTNPAVVDFLTNPMVLGTRTCTNSLPGSLEAPSVSCQ